MNGPQGTVPVGVARTMDGKDVVILALPTGELIPVIQELR